MFVDFSHVLRSVVLSCIVNVVANWWTVQQSETSDCIGETYDCIGETYDCIGETSDCIGLYYKNVLDSKGWFTAWWQDSEHCSIELGCIENCE